VHIEIAGSNDPEEKKKFAVQNKDGAEREIYEKIRAIYFKGGEETRYRHVYIYGPFPIYRKLMKGLEPIFLLYPELSERSLFSGDFHRVAADCILTRTNDNGKLSLPKMSRLIRQYSYATGGNVAPILVAYNEKVVPSLSEVQTAIQTVFERPEYLCNDQTIRMAYGVGLRNYALVYKMGTTDHEELLYDLYGRVFVRDYIASYEILDTVAKTFLDPLSTSRPSMANVLQGIEKARYTHQENADRILENVAWKGGLSIDNNTRGRSILNWTVAEDERLTKFMEYVKTCESILRYHAIDYQFKVLESSEWINLGRDIIFRAFKAYLYEEGNWSGYRDSMDVTYIKKHFEKEIRMCDDTLARKHSGLIPIEEIGKMLARSDWMRNVHRVMEEEGKNRVVALKDMGMELRQFAYEWETSDRSVKQQCEAIYAACMQVFNFQTDNGNIVKFYENAYTAKRRDFVPKRDEQNRFMVALDRVHNGDENTISSPIANLAFDGAMWNIPLHTKSSVQSLRIDTDELYGMDDFQRYVRESHVLRSEHSICVTPPGSLRQKEIKYSLSEKRNTLLLEHVNKLLNNSFDLVSPPICIFCDQTTRTKDLMTFLDRFEKSSLHCFVVMYAVGDMNRLRDEMKDFLKNREEIFNRIHTIELQCAPLSTRDQLILVDKLFIHFGFPAICYLDTSVAFTSESFKEVGSLFTREGTIERFTQYAWLHYLHVRLSSLYLKRDSISKSFSLLKIYADDNDKWFFEEMEKFTPHPSLKSIEYLVKQIQKRKDLDDEFEKIIEEQQVFQKLYTIQSTYNHKLTMPTNRESCVMITSTSNQLGWTTYLKVFPGVDGTSTLYQSPEYDVITTSPLKNVEDRRESIQTAQGILLAELHHGNPSESSILEWSYVLPFYEVSAWMV
jgi:hypothetical protein